MICYSRRAKHMKPTVIDNQGHTMYFKLLFLIPEEDKSNLPNVGFKIWF